MASKKSGVIKAGGAEIWVEDGIIHIRDCKEKYTIEDVKEQFQSLDELAQAFKGKAKVLVEMGVLKSIERDARIYMVQVITADKYAKGAGVFRNPVQRFIASFALGLQKLDIPVNIFGDIKEAETWLKE